MELPMADDTRNTIPDEELFDVEGEAESAEDDSQDDVSGDDPGTQVIDLDADDGEAVIEDDDDQSSDDEKSYGKKVARRISGMTGRHNQEIADKNREIAGLKRVAFEAQGAALDSNITGLKSEYSSLEESYKQAVEDGDTDKQSELHTKMLDVRIDMRAAESRQDPSRRKPSASDDPPDGGDTRREPTGPVDPLANLRPKAQGWAKRVGFINWTNSQRGLTLGIDSELTNEGFDQNTDEYFDELDRRIGELYPELYTSDDEEPDPQPKPKRKIETNVRGAPPTKPNAGNSGNKVTLGPADYANMRKFKLDPKNPEHVKAYAAEKRNG